MILIQIQQPLTDGIIIRVPEQFDCAFDAEVGTSKLRAVLVAVETEADPADAVIVIGTG